MTERQKDSLREWAPTYVTVVMGVVAVGVGWGVFRTTLGEHERRIVAVEVVAPLVPEHEKRLGVVEGIQTKTADVLERLDRRTLLLACKASPDSPECVP